jgi:crotonobetainyl-CoA:carnitine CoA-transferase CaiB-like acyl-CoA transferase
LATAFGVDSSDPDLAHAPDRSRNREKFHKVLVEIREKATTFTVSEAEELLEANNVPFGAIRRVDEVPTDPQVVANELFSEHDHPAAGRVRQHRAPAQFLGTPAQMTEPSAPTLGQHTDQVVAETGRGNEIANLREAGVIA